MSLDDLRRRESIQGPPGSLRPGLWRAVVTDNDDPTKRGRLQVRIPEITGDDGAHPAWAWPASGLGARGKGGGRRWGDLWLPEIGDPVAIEFVGGDPDHPSWLPGWILDDATPATLLTHYPKRRGLVTPSGHALFFDDSAGTEGDVVLQQRDGAALTLAGSGEVRLDAKTGTLVKLQGGGAAAARVGDEVRVTIPAGVVVVNVVMGAPVMNPAPITLTGTITRGSSKTEIG